MSTTPDRERFTARRVGPLDLNMLEDQQDALAQIRAEMSPDAAPWKIDAIDGMIHLTGYLSESYDYAVQEAARPARDRVRILLQEAADALIRADAVLEESENARDDGEGPAVELRWNGHAHPRAGAGLADLATLIAALLDPELIDHEPVAVAIFPELAPVW